MPVKHDEAPAREQEARAALRDLGLADDLRIDN
jgi:hypothetical protein